VGNFSSGERPQKNLSGFCLHQIFCLCRDSQLYFSIINLHRIGRRVVNRRQGNCFSGANIEASPVARADDLVAHQVAVPQGTIVVGA